MSELLVSDVDLDVLESGGLRVNQVGPVVTITLSRPDTRNAQLPATWRALASVGASLGPDVRVVVLQADGSSFSAGLDRRMFVDGIPGEPSLAGMAAISVEEFDSRIAEFQRGFTWWRESDAITISVVQGHAVGAGFQLALATDLMVVADDVSLSMKETQLGLVPDLGGTHPLVHTVGYPRALEICLSGRKIGATEAVASGLAIASAPAAGLRDRTEALVDQILRAPQGATVETKHLLAGAPGSSRQQQASRERQAQRRRVLDLAQLSGADSN
jgi:enoyl-CoA hydratase/carnithine racemase